jgi:hypothetical protein
MLQVVVVVVATVLLRPMVGLISRADTTWTALHCAAMMGPEPQTALHCATMGLESQTVLHCATMIAMALMRWRWG